MTSLHPIHIGDDLRTGVGQDLDPAVQIGYLRIKSLPVLSQPPLTDSLFQLILCVLDIGLITLYVGDWMQLAFDLSW